MAYDLSKLKTYIKGNLPKIDESPLTFLSAELSTVSASIRQIIDALRGIAADVAATVVSIAAHESAWTAYTPTITAGTGTFGTVSATGRYKTIGKTVFVKMEITVTAVGTASASAIASLPVTAAGTNGAVFVGRENAISGSMLQGLVPAGASFVTIYAYNNSTPYVANAVLILSGVYESA